MAEKDVLLIIDPVEKTRSMTVYVAKQKYHVLTAETPAVAQKRLSESALTLNGILVHVTDKEWLQFIRDHGRDFPILALSPIATDRAQQLLKSAGARLVLTAPFTGMQVNMALKKLMRLPPAGADEAEGSVVA